MSFSLYESEKNFCVLLISTAFELKWNSASTEQKLFVNFNFNLNATRKIIKMFI